MFLLLLLSVFPVCASVNGILNLRLQLFVCCRKYWTRATAHQKLCWRRHVVNWCVSVLQNAQIRVSSVSFGYVDKALRSLYKFLRKTVRLRLSRTWRGVPRIPFGSKSGEFHWWILWPIVGYHISRDTMSCKYSFQFPDNGWAQCILQFLDLWISAIIINDQEVIIAIENKQVRGDCFPGSTCNSSVDISSSFWFAAVLSKQITHLDTNSCICAFIPGQNNTSLALFLHF